MNKFKKVRLLLIGLLTITPTISYGMQGAQTSQLNYPQQVGRWVKVKTTGFDTIGYYRGYVADTGFSRKDSDAMNRGIAHYTIEDSTTSDVIYFHTSIYGKTIRWTYDIGGKILANRVPTTGDKVRKMDPSPEDRQNAKTETEEFIGKFSEVFGKG